MKDKKITVKKNPNLKPSSAKEKAFAQKVAKLTIAALNSQKRPK